MNCCDYDRCTQGRDCPARQTPYRLTPAELRAQQFQADTDRAAAQACTACGDLPTPTGPLSDDPPEGPGALVAVACIGVWFIAVGLVFGLGGYVWSLTQ